MRAFTDGAKDPARRPSAAEWRNALLRVRIATCSRGIHQFPATSLKCPWCAIDDERARRQQKQRSTRQGTTLPRPAVPAANPKPKAQPPGLTRNMKLILTGPYTVIAVVVVLTIFMVWAILSGASTFGT